MNRQLESDVKNIKDVNSIAHYIDIDICHSTYIRGLSGVGD